MNLFEKLNHTITDSNELDCYLNNNLYSILDYYNNDYQYLLNSKRWIGEFIQLKSRLIEGLDFNQSYNRTFCLLMLDICVRFNYRASTTRLINILRENNIVPGKRLEASLLYIENISSNDVLIERFEPICDLLNKALQEEEDDEKRVHATFLSYVAVVVEDTSLKYVGNLLAKFNEAREKNVYTFLNSEKLNFLVTVSSLSYELLEEHIDSLLQKRKVTGFDSDELLIEEGTEYVELLEDVSATFDDIRSITKGRADGTTYTNRGVNILDRPEQLLDYMYKVGFMHRAKLEAAFDSIEDSFEQKVRIIDWGCGQGIASLVFLERYGVDSVKEIILIEPSLIAIKRATLHIQKLAPAIPVRTVCKSFDDLTKDYFKPQAGDWNVHLFSNVLDMDNYSHQLLFDLIENSQTGRNYFICSSPYITPLQTERLNTFKRYFEKNHTYGFYSFLEVDSKKGFGEPYWLCNTNRNNRVRRHGISPYCGDYTNEGGCWKKWTRVLRVFKVEWESV